MKNKPTAFNKAKWDLQVKIAERAEREIKGCSPLNRMSMMMDLDSADEDVGIDLEKLLSFPPFDFAHDICGIARHMDRSSYPGKLKDCFVPRCARQTVAA